MINVYKVNPYKEYIFGSLKHFVAEESHYYTSAESLNIMRFFKIVEDLKKGDSHLKIYGISFYKEDDNKEIYIPLPADILFPRKGEGGNPIITKYSQNKPFIKGTTKNYEYKPAYISLTSFINYMNNSIENLNLEENIFKKQEKAGIALDYETKISRFSEEKDSGRLYFTQRLGFIKHFKIAFMVSGDLKEDCSFLGAERNKVKIEKAEVKNLDKLQNDINIEKDNIYKFYLLSHGFFDVEKEIKINDLTFEVLWMFSAGSEWISGYKKPALYMLKPGTVLVLKAKNSGKLNMLCQIFPVEDVNSISKEKNFLDFGWNSGIIF